LHNIFKALQAGFHNRVAKSILAAIGAVLLVLVVAVAGIELWPLGSDRLQHAMVKTSDFGSASAQAQHVVQADGADPQVRPECRSRFLSHGHKTAKAVLLLHGYKDCPAQYSSLARLFFDRGYNVYVPRAPRHGVTDLRAHAKIKADELVNYADDSMNIVAQLGDEVGVAGISGGGVLATWLAEYHTESVQHLLVLSGFYKPSPAQAPNIVIKPFTVLFGFRILPDHFNSNDFSYAALSQYLRIKANFRGKPKNEKLKSVATVVSANDTFIDLRTAVGLPRTIAETNKIPLGVHELPADLGVGHDVLTPAGLHGRADELNNLYFALYEGTQAK
jgi:carboxylesterase